MEQAFNQAHEQNMRKVMDLVAAEDKVSRLQAEKSKADQKYFAAMKAKDQLTLEVKVLRAQTGKSAETVSRLHEVEEISKQKIQNLENQISLFEKTSGLYNLEISKAQAVTDKYKLRSEEMKSQLIAALTRAEGKEHEIATMTSAKRSMYEELELLKKKYERVKGVESTKSGPVEESDQLQVYRVSPGRHI